MTLLHDKDYKLRIFCTDVVRWHVRESHDTGGLRVGICVEAISTCFGTPVRKNFSCADLLGQ